MLRSRTHDVRAPGRASSASPGRTMSTPELEHALRLFPTLVHIFRLSDYETLNATLERRIRKVRRKHPLWKGLPSPWQCAPTLHEDDAFKPLVSAIRQASQQVIDAYRYDVERLEITAMWANMLSRGEFHRPHVHGNNFLSGVYYVKGGQGAQIHFMTPNSGSQVIVPHCIEHTIDNSDEWRVDAGDGRLILFPSWLTHFVGAVQTDERISIAFNVMLRGQMAPRDSLQGGRF